MASMFPRHFQNQGPITLTFFTQNSNTMNITISCYSIPGYQITTKFCTCHDSCAIMTCAKFWGDHSIKIWITPKLNFHWIWITSEKLWENVSEMAFGLACLHATRPSPYRRFGLQCYIAITSQYHTEASTKWPLFCRRHFQMPFL